MEGKDQPKNRGKPEFEENYGETGGLMICITKPLFGTEKDVVIDSGFCALKEIVGMLAHGVYGTTAMKEKNAPSTEREAPLRHASETTRLGVFTIFFFDLDGHKYKIQFIK